MPSNDLKGDVMAMFTEHRETIITAGAVGLVVLLLLALFGGVNVIGGLLFVGYAAVWVAVVLFVLWLFYRLVTAVERIAAAQERIASAHDPAAAVADEPTTAAAAHDDSGREHDTTGTDDAE